MAFGPRRVSHILILSRLQQFVVSYLADSLYSADDLKVALKNSFGKQQSILDYSHATASGAKVGLSVTTISETSSCIFTNYNRIGMRAQDCGRRSRKLRKQECNAEAMLGYHVIPAQDGFRRVQVWEMCVNHSCLYCFLLQLIRFAASDVDPQHLGS